MAWTRTLIGGATSTGAAADATVGVLTVTSTATISGDLVLNDGDADNDVNLTTSGAGANITLNLYAKGTSYVQLGNGVAQPWFAATGPATGGTNYVQATGELTGIGPGINAVGLDANISITVYAKNAGNVSLGTLTAPTTSTQFFNATGSVSSVNYLQTTASIAASAPRLEAIGSDANITLRLLAKAAALVSLGNQADVWFEAGGTAGAVNNLRASAAIATAPPQLQAVGTDTNISLQLTPKGTGGVVLASFYIEGTEMSDPAAPSADRGRLYFRDNGAARTQLVARFPTGAVQVIATEP